MRLPALSAVGLVAMVLAAAPARPCECSSTVLVRSLTPSPMPRDGVIVVSVDFPASGVDHDTSELTLVATVDDVPVEGTLTRISTPTAQPELLVLRPDASLPAGAKVLAAITGVADELLPAEELLVAIDVGDELADDDSEDAPSLALVDTIAGEERRDGCGGTQFIARLDVGAEGALATLIDVDGASTLVEGEPSGVVSGARGDYVGFAECGNGNGWPDATFGASATIRAAVLGVAGKVSPFSAPLVVTLPGDADDDGVSDDDDECPNDAGVAHFDGPSGAFVGGCPGGEGEGEAGGDNEPDDARGDDDAPAGGSCAAAPPPTVVALGAILARAVRRRR